VTLAVAPHVARATAVDVTDALAPRHAPAGFEFVAYDGFELPLPPASVDFVYSNDVVEHLHPDDLGDHLRGVLRVLRADGRYLCVTPNRLSGPHDVSRHFAETPQGFHLREYTLGELADRVATAGFRGAETLTSVSGYAVGRVPGIRAVRAMEAALELLPHRARCRAARPLAAVKLVARA
jgi:SAM-dependent methyltransferase